MTKVCYLNLVTFSKTGGIENYNKTFLTALSRQENKEVIAISIYDKAHEHPIINGVKFKNFDGHRLNAVKFLIPRLQHIDILILAHVNLVPVALIAQIFKPGLKIYLNIYGIDVWKKLPFLYQFVLKRATIFSISRYTTETFIKYNPFIKQEQIVYLPPAIDLTIKPGSENPYQIDEYNILTVSRLDSNDNYKGIDSIIKTLPLLTKEIKNIKYTIIGKGSDKTRLENLAQQLGVQNQVQFKGFVEHIEPYYEYCDLFILPSKNEGFGIVYLEAMKYKKPVIAANSGGVTDVVLDSHTGFLCEYDNIDCLTDKILKFSMNGELAIKLGENGYKYLIENFTFNQFTQRLLSFFKGNSYD
ncbi:MAG: glycosyltransferase [Methyloprofundus sp.]|nr:glycosyltransferase [Methyloprofundus sp.]